MSTFSPAVDRFVVQQRRLRVLIVDDVPAVRRSIRRVLGSTHFVYSEADGIEDAAARMSQRMTPDLVILDLSLDGRRDGGLGLLQDLGAHNLKTAVIIFSGYADIPLTVEAMRLGAFDVVIKAGDFDKLRNAVSAALENVIQSQTPNAKVSGSRWRAQRPVVDEDKRAVSERPTTFREEMDRAKRDKITQILAYTNGNFSEAARLAEMDPANLRRLAMRLGVQPKISDVQDFEEKKKRSR